MRRNLGSIGCTEHRFTHDFLHHIPDRSVISGQCSNIATNAPKISLASNSANGSAPITLKQLIALCEPAPCGKGDQTVVDPLVRKTKQVADLSKIVVQWDDLQVAVDRINSELLAASPLQIDAAQSQLHSVLYYETGDLFKEHRDSKKSPSHLMTLTVNAVVKSQPTSPKLHGGWIFFPQVDDIEQSRWCSDKAGDWAAWFTTEPHLVQQVHQGVRVSVQYNLMAVPKSAQAVSLLPPALQHAGVSKSVVDAFKSYFSDVVSSALEYNKNNNNVNAKLTHGAVRKEPKKHFGFLLCHQYCCDGDDQDLRKSIRGRDRVMLEILESVVKNIGTTPTQAKLIPVSIVAEQPRLDVDLLSGLLFKLDAYPFLSNSDRAIPPMEAAARQKIEALIVGDGKNDDEGDAADEEAKKKRTEELNKQLAYFRMGTLVQVKERLAENKTLEMCEELRQAMFDHHGNITIVENLVERNADNAQQLFSMEGKSEDEQLKIHAETQFGYELDDERPIRADKKIGATLQLANAIPPFVRVTGLVNLSSGSSGHQDSLWGNSATFSMFWSRAVVAVLPLPESGLAGLNVLLDAQEEEEDDEVHEDAENAPSTKTNAAKRRGRK